MHSKSESKKKVRQKFLIPYKLKVKTWLKRDVIANLYQTFTLYFLPFYRYGD